MPNEDTLIQLLLLDELLDVLSHRTIIVLGGMERLSMVSQVLISGLAAFLIK